MYRISTEHELTLEALCSQMLLLGKSRLQPIGLAGFTAYRVGLDISSSGFHDNVLRPR